MGSYRSRRILRPACTLLSIYLLLCLTSSCLPAQAPAKADERAEQLYLAAKEAEARGDVADAAAKYQAILESSPQLGAAYNNLGALYLRHGEYQKAAEVLQRGLKVDPKLQSAAALLGVAQYEMRDYPAARKILESALRMNPKDTNAEMFLANTLIQMNEQAEAARHLQQITQRNPGNQEAWYLLGKVYIQLAEHAIVKVNEIDPNSTLVHQLSGEIMESMQNYDGALVEYKKAVEMAPSQPGTHLHLGNAYFALAMWDPAAEQFRAELENDPQNCEAQWKLGNIDLEQHAAYEAAIDKTNQALQLCPNLREAHVDRGRAFLKLGRNAEAIQDLKIAVQADPSVSSTHFLLAQAYRAEGQTQQAQAEMQLFSKLEESSRAASTERLRNVLKSKDQPN